jgi:hypothetical protein
MDRTWVGHALVAFDSMRTTHGSSPFLGYERKVYGLQADAQEYETCSAIPETIGEAVPDYISPFGSSPSSSTGSKPAKFSTRHSHGEMSKSRGSCRWDQRRSRRRRIVFARPFVTCPITRWRALPPVRLLFSTLLQQITPMACRQL